VHHVIRQAIRLLLARVTRVTDRKLWIYGFGAKQTLHGKISGGLTGNIERRSQIVF
jgi:hypothetical protein